MYKKTPESDGHTCHWMTHGGKKRWGCWAGVSVLRQAGQSCDLGRLPVPSCKCGLWVHSDCVDTVISR